MRRLGACEPLLVYAVRCSGVAGDRCRSTVVGTLVCGPPHTGKGSCKVCTACAKGMEPTDGGGSATTCPDEGAVQTSPCKKCDAGRFKAGMGGDKCAACEAGKTYQAEQGVSVGALASCGCFVWGRPHFSLPAACCTASTHR